MDRLGADDSGARYPVEVDPINTTESVTLTGAASSNYLGWSRARAGDVNGDGYDDVIVGAPLYSSSRGRAFVYLGYGDPIVDDDGAGYGLPEDCDDTSAAVNPGATEICDAAGTDEDCDGADAGDPAVPKTEASGCGCASGPPAGGMSWVLLGAVLPARRRGGVTG